MRTFFITGGCGFIGRNLINKLSEDPDNFYFPYESNVCEEIKIKNDFDIIYHLAANTDTRFPNDIEMFENNIRSFLQIIKFTLKNDKSKLIYASSASQYGNYKKTAYAISKIVCDDLAKFFFDKIKIVGLRFFNVFGKYESKKGKMASMITQWKEQLKNNERPTCFSEGRQVKRDHIYVKDVVKALVMAQKLKNGIYDVGSGKSTSFDEVLKLVQKTLGTHKKPNFIPNPYLASYQKFTKANLNWGFKPDFTLQEGIKDYFQNY